jgi:two-component system chemotaxis sensor kinase CheA
MKRTIYVVDDVPTNIELVEAVFRNDPDIEIKKAENGSECIDLMDQNGHPDLLVLGLMMTVTDGFEALKKIKDSYFLVIVLLKRLWTI